MTARPPSASAVPPSAPAVPRLRTPGSVRLGAAADRLGAYLSALRASWRTPVGDTQPDGEPGRPTLIGGRRPPAGPLAGQRGWFARGSPALDAVGTPVAGLVRRLARSTVAQALILAAAWWAEADPQFAILLGCAHDDGAPPLRLAALLRLVLEPFDIELRRRRRRDPLVPAAACSSPAPGRDRPARADGDRAAAARPGCPSRSRSSRRRPRPARSRCSTPSPGTCGRTVRRRVLLRGPAGVGRRDLAAPGRAGGRALAVGAAARRRAQAPRAPARRAAGRPGGRARGAGWGRDDGPLVA